MRKVKILKEMGYFCKINFIMSTILAMGRPAWSKILVNPGQTGSSGGSSNVVPHADRDISLDPVTTSKYSIIFNFGN